MSNTKSTSLEGSRNTLLIHTLRSTYYPSWFALDALGISEEWLEIEIRRLTQEVAAIIAELKLVAIWEISEREREKAKIAIAKIHAMDRGISIFNEFWVEYGVESTKKDPKKLKKRTKNIKDEKLLEFIADEKIYLVPYSNWR